jgi:hypothetical protein
MSISTRFIHIPRTGGTSIQRALGNLSIGHSIYKRNYKEFSWCVFRDPVDRFISCFKHLKHSGINAVDRANAQQYIGEKNIHQFIENGIEKAASEQQHFLPQTHWMPNGVNKIIPFTALEDEFNKLYPDRKLHYFNQSAKISCQLSEVEKKKIRDIYYLDNLIYVELIRQHYLFEPA